MPGAEFLKDYRGVAGGWTDVQALEELGPLALISRPVYAPRHHQPDLKLTPFEVPALDSDDRKRKSNFSAVPPAGFEVKIQAADLNIPERNDWEKRAFRTLLAKKDCFALGGTKLITQFGIRAAWLRHNGRREEVHERIGERKWGPLLRALRGRENEENESLSLIGQRDISDYLSALPPLVNRKASDNDEFEDEDVHQELSAFRRRKFLSLRLRKAIELALSIETVLADRFARTPPRSVERFQHVSGLPPEKATASYVWDHLWFEPIIYVVTPRPQPINIQRIAEQEMQSGRFAAETGQDPKILYRILYGAPCSWNVCMAAAGAVNRFYGNRSRTTLPKKGPYPAIAATVRPHEYDERRRIIDEADYRVDGFGIPEEFQDAYEDLLLPGIIAPPLAEAGAAAQPPG